MNFGADESVDRPIVRSLRNEGHIVVFIAESSPGVPDEIVLQMANSSDAILLTADNDFGELVFRQGRLTTGVLLIRLTGLTANAKADTVADAVHKHSAAMSGAFAVVSPVAIRIRHAGL